MPSVLSRTIRTGPGECVHETALLHERGENATLDLDEVAVRLNLKRRRLRRARDMPSDLHRFG